MLNFTNWVTSFLTTIKHYLIALDTLLACLDEICSAYATNEFADRMRAVRSIHLWFASYMKIYLLTSFCR